MEGKHQKTHAIMIPFPLQGHINPSVNLALNLASKGFTITFVNTESNHQQITKSQPSTATINDHPDHDIFFQARKSGLDIRYAIVSDGLPIEFDRSLNRARFMEAMTYVFSAHIDVLLGKIMVHETNHPLTCLITDGCFMWSSMVARKYDLINVSFWTQPALVFTLYYHWDLLKSNGHFRPYDNRQDTIDYIPGVEAIKPKDLTSYLQAGVISSIVPKMLEIAFKDVKNADFIICNTVQELEFTTISALQQKQPFYPVGPIFPNGLTKRIVDTSLWAESECAQWLNSRPNGSVLYISFGSYAHCSKKDIGEIAHGLLLSKVSFIWVLRPDIVSSDETEFLPVGFEEEVKDQGLIVPWCCQLEVISHPTVGGFLTHCGWNSILESISCDVPLLCFPLLTDQFTNRKLVVDDWKVGINLCDGKTITEIEVAENINRLMSGKSGFDLRKNVKEVKEKLDSALCLGGSSEQNFNQFIDDVMTKIKKKTRSLKESSLTIWSL